MRGKVLITGRRATSADVAKVHGISQQRVRILAGRITLSTVKPQVVKKIATAKAQPTKVVSAKLVSKRTSAAASRVTPKFPRANRPGRVAGKKS